VDYWLLSAHGLSAALQQVLNNPANLLIVAGLTIISAMFPRALWHSASQQAHLMSTALAGHHFAAAAIDAISIALVVMSIAGSIYVAAGLAGRAWKLGLRWSAGRPARRLGTAATAIAATALLAIFWAVHGQFEVW
jgi:hypothetical protein